MENLQISLNKSIAVTTNKPPYMAIANFYRSLFKYYMHYPNVPVIQSEDKHSAHYMANLYI